eukprot:1289563-Amphidinium_carterae.1
MSSTFMPEGQTPIQLQERTTFCHQQTLSAITGTPPKKSECLNHLVTVSVVWFFHDGFEHQQATFSSELCACARERNTGEEKTGFLQSLDAFLLPVWSIVKKQCTETMGMISEPQPMDCSAEGGPPSENGCAVCFSMACN